MSNKHRSWCFTLNNYTDESLKLCEEFFDSKCKYLVVGREVGVNGTHHLQGYFTLRSPNTLSALKKAFQPSSPHFEVAKGNAEQNFQYCSKDGNFQEYGIRPKDAKTQAKLNSQDYADFIACAKKGEMEKAELGWPKLYLQYYNTALRIKAENEPKPPALEKPCGEWWFGPSGTGKSYLAHRIGCFQKNASKWWDGYVDGTPVVCQDVDHTNWDYFKHWFKIWPDRYPFYVEFKGGSRWIRPPIIIVTSNYMPSDLFKPEDAQIIGPIVRRWPIRYFTEVHQDKPSDLMTDEQLFEKFGDCMAAPVLSQASTQPIEFIPPRQPDIFDSDDEKQN